MNQQLHRRLVARTIQAIGAGVALAGGAGLAQAQRYELVHGGPDVFERAYDMEVVDPEGGYVTVGEYTTGAPSDIHVVRFDALGNTVWDFQYRVEGLDIGYSVDVLSDGDIVVAGWRSSTSVPGGFDTVVMRLRPSGAVVWAFTYPGTAFSDPIHTPEVGPSLIVGREDELFVTSSFQGAPVAMRIRPDGTLVWVNLYFYPFDDRDVRPAFSDIKYDAEEDTLVISGTVRIVGETPGLPFSTLQDPMLLRLKAADGSYVFGSHTNLSTGSDLDDREVGEGLDIRRGSREIALAGESDALRATGGPLVQLLTISDPGLVTTSATLFGNNQADNNTGSAAVRYDFLGREIGIAGALGFPGGEATITVADPSGIITNRRNSADQADFDTIVPAPSCGWLAAGRIGGFLIGGPGDLFHAKTNDTEETGCNRVRETIQLGLEPRTFELPLEPEPLEGQREYPAFPLDPFDQNAALCFDRLCDCLADWNMDGMVNVLDVVAFINDWNAMLPSTDLDMSGTINILDVVAFINLWNMGCP